MKTTLNKGDKVITSLGEGLFLGIECYKTVNKKEVFSIEENTENFSTTGRKAVKMTTGEKEGEVLYFYPSDSVNKL